MEGFVLIFLLRGFGLLISMVNVTLNFRRYGQSALLHDRERQRDGAVHGNKKSSFGEG